MLYSCVTPGSVQYSIRAMSPLRATIPSVNRNPAASSKSWPGVRIVTDKEASPVAPSGRSPRESPSALPPPAGPTPDSGGHRAPSTPWRPSLVPVASWSHPGGGQRFDAHEGVVVRHLARGVDDPTADEQVTLGPVDLHVPRSDRSETQATPIGTAI